jgi:hypothetical protein
MLVSIKWPGLVGRWATPTGPKLKKWGLQKAHPKFGPIWGQLPIFEFLFWHYKFFSFIGVGVVVKVWLHPSVGT